ncbi:hypothetical protein P700755_000314 [Psychroflexus torquis ATCC 700755]|uniref:Uncharacterized protein n=1 Tax=Psychroflexus torquis (strain ATCC 700755 / CIP 106069 / ACAM 623) TaxID=313595 RepID=K4I9Q0_PSYTT|nr:hypothetical protein P700755_000314 [Psychroflexus torquis ATCC 700755]
MEALLLIQSRALTLAKKVISYFLQINLNFLCKIELGTFLKN